MKKLLKWFFKDVWAFWIVAWLIFVWHIPFWQCIVFSLGMIISLAVKEILKPDASGHDYDDLSAS